MRRLFSVCAAGCIVGVALFTGLPNALRWQGPLEVAAGGTAAGGKEQEFLGVSARRSLAEALADALRQMDKALDDQEIPCNLASWRVVEIGGKTGSPANLNNVQVKIAASFQTRKEDRRPPKDVRKDRKGLGERVGPVYGRADQIKAMPACKATVVQRAPCFVYLEMADGKGFYIGSPASTADVGRFLDVLQDGKTYDLPGAFLEYQRKGLPGKP